MERIASFCVDHTKLDRGMYLSRQDGDVLTWDIRMKKPNQGDYLTTGAAHTLEHLFATYARNSAVKDGVIYVGPMGCRTGFYLLTRGLTPAQASASTAITASGHTALASSTLEITQMSVHSPTNNSRRYPASRRNPPKATEPNVFFSNDPITASPRARSAAATAGVSSHPALPRRQCGTGSFLPSTVSG